MKELIVLPGLGSPHNEKYIKVFSPIVNEGHKKDTCVSILDYVGYGHQPVYGSGLSLENAMKITKKKLTKANKGSILLARSFGCNLTYYILKTNPSLLDNFSKIVLWGTPYYHVWKGYQETGIKEWNENAISKGIQLAQDFFDYNMNAEEMLLLINSDSLKGKKVIFAVGTDDVYSDENYNNTLCGILSKKGMDAIVHVVHGADHPGLFHQLDKEVAKEYIDLVFD